MIDEEYFHSPIRSLIIFNILVPMIFVSIIAGSKRYKIHTSWV